MRLKFTPELLNDHIDKCGATLAQIYIATNRETIIQFVCSCGAISEKCFRLIVENAGAYCKKCSQKRREEKQSKTLTNLYGVSNISKSSSHQTKKIETNKKIYGVEYSFQSEEVKHKIKESLLKHYGVDNISKSEEIKIKKINTNIIKRGVENPAQDPDISYKQLKRSYCRKDYICPSGTIRIVQGYEPFALNDLFKSYNENDIITDRRLIPTITYEHENRKRRYFPDIFIKSENKIIEVKSDYTYKKEQTINKLKRQACIDCGFAFEFWLYNPSGKRIFIKELEALHVTPILRTTQESVQ
jgi:hypothetical protein